ncbi:MAG: substrate-binding domain-containing protein [Treponema sp.]|nr:substrate-binding domain-containing protein [Treponema sp.]
MREKIIFVAAAVCLALSPVFVFARGAAEGSSPGASQSAPSQEAPKTPVTVKGTIRLSTTTSTQDSGLLDYLLPKFTAATGWNVDVISVGTGAALQMGRDGEADVLLVHAKAQEEEFVSQGHGLKRFDVMYNDFIVVGPPAPIAHNDDVQGTFKAIANQNLPFVSRGDKSGTHTMELSLWKAAGIEPDKLSKYTSAGQGMGATLQMANEMQAYTLADRATWLKQKNSSLVIVCEKGTELLNFYGVIAVNPAKNSRINAQGAQDFVSWILSPAAQALIGQYGVEEFGGPLFTPNAGANR